MEFLVAIGASFVTKIGDCTVSNLNHRLAYLFYYKTSIANLKTQTQHLRDAKERLQHSIDHAKRRGEEIEADVQNWLNRVDVISEEVESFLNDQVQANMECCNTRSFPNLAKRYRLGRKAEKMVKDVVQIKDSARFDNISYLPILQSIFYTKGFMTFETRNSIFEGIMEALVDDDNVSMIGVYGMAGVGKTTLVKEIARLALEKKLFNDAIVIVVSQTPSYEKIQQEVADKLGLVFHETSVKARADRLKYRLSKEEKFLVVLDDVWKKLDLVDVGIYFEDDQKGCKILLTSRFQDVLGNHMGVQKNFSVELLAKDEALNWFGKIVDDDSTKNSETQLLATQIVEECGCLPIAILTVGHALKNKSLSSWKDALRQLQRSNPTNIEGMNEKVYTSIKLSYDFLESEEAKSLFLICGLHEEDANIGIENLLRYAMGWGLFQDVYKMDEARDRLQTVVDKLKAHCLLMDGDYLHTVKMHDIIRDVAISIASNDNHMYNIRNSDDLKELLNKNKLKDSTAISLVCDDVDHLPERLESTQLQFVRIRKVRYLQIPDRFFEEAKVLKVVDLSSSYIGALPSSLCFLQNLQALCLRDCWLRDIALIAELKSLEILDLSRSNIEELPEQIGQLTHLKLLDLTSCSRLKVIPPNVISSLIHLEELYLKKSFSKWEVEDANGDRSNASLIELKNLAQLTTLHLEIPNANTLPKGLFHEKIERFKILVGNLSSWNDRETSRMLKLIDFTKSSLSEEHGLKRLLKRSKELYLYGFEGVENFVHELDLEGFPQLNHLILKDCNEIRFIVNSVGKVHPCCAFPSLESLSLRYLMKLQNICHGKLTVESFSRLRVLEVSYCYCLDYLFSISIARSLLQLKDIQVSNCPSMEEIVGCGLEDVDALNVSLNMEFPQLCSLRLTDLVNIQQFCLSLKHEDLLVPHSCLFNEKIISLPKLETLELSLYHIENIWDKQLTESTCFQNLVTLLVDKCERLKNLFSSYMAVVPAQLKRLEIVNCGMMEEVIRIDKMVDKMSFPRLNYLKLQNLRNLTKFCNALFLEFPLLIELFISDCPKLGTFISKSDEQNHCTTTLFFFNDKVSLPSLKKLSIAFMGKLKMIWSHQLTTVSFSKLEELEINKCGNLINIFPYTMLRRLGSLRKLRIWNCKMVEEVFEIQIPNIQEEACDSITVTQLNEMDIFGLPNLKHVWSKDPRGILTFSNLHKVDIYQCPNLKYLFPPSVAKDLLQLEVLCVIDSGIKQIVAKELEGTFETRPKFVFPRLTDLCLLNVPNLVTFYPGSHTSEWPLLKWLVVCDCTEVNVFALECLSCHDIRAQQHLFFIEKATFPTLQKLSLARIVSLNKIWDGQYEGLVGEEEHGGILLSNIRELKLSDLPNLMHLWEESTHPCTAYKNLDTLEVQSCVGLLNLVPSSVSFLNLVNLRVSECHGMVYLLTSSTAKSMTKLKRMSITKCERMTRIIPNDEGGEIVFDQLKVLELVQLPSLTSFYSGNYMMKFPSLEKVVVRQCPEMKTFSSGAIITPMLHKLLIDMEDGNSNESDAESEDGYAEWSSHHVDTITPIEDINSIMSQHRNCDQNDMGLQQLFAEKDDEQIHEEHSDGNFEEDDEDFMSAGSSEIVRDCEGSFEAVDGNEEFYYY